MSKPAAQPQPTETPEQALARRQNELRDVIDEMLWGICIHANVGRDYIAMKDDAGLEYSMRQIFCRAKILREVGLQLRTTRTADPQPMRAAA